jgi:hypothetical protein
MSFRLASLIVVTSLTASAQETRTVEGRVTSSTAPEGIAEVAVTVASQHATTDPSGTFQFAGLPLGSYIASFKAAGFFDLDWPFRLDPGIDAFHLDARLIPHSSLYGRVLDEAGNSMAGVVVEVTAAVRGTGTTWTIFGATTDSQGRYHVDTLPPGTYVAMARPNRICAAQSVGGDRRACVNTYYPSVSERSQAGGLSLRGGTQLAADIRILAVPVYTIHGMIYDDGGRPANATVSLFPFEAMQNPVAALNPLAQKQSRDGVFEFPDVPSGTWHVTAEAERPAGKLRGAASALLHGHDVDNLTLHLAPPFPVAVIVEPHGAVESTTIELYPAEASPGGAAFSTANSDGSLTLPVVYPGRYTVDVFATIPDYYLESVRLGEQDALGKEVTLAEGAPPIHVVFKPNSAGLRGTVENCGTASVLLLPQDEGLWNFRFIRRVSCDSSGHFDIRDLRPGNYYALALDRIDPSGLDDLSTLRRLANQSTKVQVDPGLPAYIELKMAVWPE